MNSIHTRSHFKIHNTNSIHAPHYGGVSFSTQTKTTMPSYPASSCHTSNPPLPILSQHFYLVHQSFCVSYLPPYFDTDMTISKARARPARRCSRYSLRSRRRSISYSTSKPIKCGSSKHAFRFFSSQYAALDKLRGWSLAARGLDNDIVSDASATVSWNPSEGYDSEDDLVGLTLENDPITLAHSIARECIHSAIDLAFARYVEPPSLPIPEMATPPPEDAPLKVHADWIAASNGAEALKLAFFLIH